MASLQTIPASGASGTRKLLRSLKRAILRAWKALMRRVTGRSEMGRILNRYEGYSSDLVQAIARSVARSSEKDAVFGKNMFDVATISAQLADKKAISEEDEPRLVWCLEVRDVRMFELGAGMAILSSRVGRNVDDLDQNSPTAHISSPARTAVQLR